MKRRNLLQGMAAAGLLPLVPGFATRALAAPGDTVRFAIAKPAGDMNPHAYKGLWGAQDLIYEPLVNTAPGARFSPALLPRGRCPTMARRLHWNCSRA